MNATNHPIVQKLWNNCSVLQNDGMGYGDSVQQLTYSRFLKMADSDDLPPPDVIAQEIVDDLEAALAQFRLIADDLAIN